MKQIEQWLIWEGLKYKLYGDLIMIEKYNMEVSVKRLIDGRFRCQSYLNTEVQKMKVCRKPNEVCEFISENI